MNHSQLNNEQVVLLHTTKAMYEQIVRKNFQKVNREGLGFLGSNIENCINQLVLCQFRNNRDLFESHYIVSQNAMYENVRAILKVIEPKDQLGDIMKTAMSFKSFEEQYLQKPKQ